MSSALTVSDLSCRYQQQTILESLSLDVEQGEIVCLLGASGCGKTTLLKAIAGLLPLSQGEVRLNGQLMDDSEHWVAPEHRNIGMIFQDYALFPHLTVSGNVGFALQDMEPEARQARVDEMLALVKLDGLQERYPHQLSGGQQQRVAIARALAYKPDLLLLDEPFSNIDTQVRHQLIGEIRKIFKQQGVTAIFVTHSREEAFAFADKMAVMNHGVIEQFGTAAELYYRPASRFVADFLGGGSYLPARRMADGEFETSLGKLPAVTGAGSEPGSEKELLLRPQQVKIFAREDGEYKVLEQQFMGDHCRYVTDVAGARLLACSNEPLSVGQRVGLELEPEGLVAF